MLLYVCRMARCGSQLQSRALAATTTALLLLGMWTPGAVALSTISDWVPGFATFYGGEPDRMVLLQAPRQLYIA